MTAPLTDLRFPVPPAAADLVLPAPIAADIAWRPARHDDIGFLRGLYGRLRATELANVPWPQALKRDFLDQQFTQQHQHYVSHFSNADFLVIEQAGHAIGRLYLDRNGDPWHLIDIGLLSPAQGRGLGSTLIGHIQQSASEHGAGVMLHVQQDNTRAQSLYRRLGFQTGALTGHHLAMHWSSGDGVS